jgi:hypothetical protein
LRRADLALACIFVPGTRPSRHPQAAVSDGPIDIVGDFRFAFSPGAFVEPASTMPELIARLRIAAALRFSRTAIEPEVSPVAARTRS